MFILNAWYVVAWSSEITREPARRVVCSIPVVLYRRQDDSVVALADRCAHRGFPLSAGTVVGDAIRCGYHGFTYDGSGSCTGIPAQERIPKSIAVQAFPIVERNGWAWIWPGDVDKADETRIPDTHWMTDSSWAAVTHTLPIDCRADLVHDNLLDLTHETFLHTSTVGDEYIVDHPVTVNVEGTVVSVDRLMPGVQAPPLYARTMNTDGFYDRFHCTEFHAPGLHILHSGITAQGRPREEGYLIKVLNGITPVDDAHCVYYYAFCRNFAVDQSWATEELREGLATVLGEDKNALELQEIGLQSRPSTERDSLIAQDAGIAKARRVMEGLLNAETATTRG